MSTRPQPPGQLTDALEAGECLVWWGHPRPLGYVTGGLMITAPAGAIALASVGSWVGSSPGGLPLWTVPVVGLVSLFALHMLLLRPLLSYRQARATLYAVTDRRALVLCRWRKEREAELAHDQGRLTVVRGPLTRKIQFSRSATSSWDAIFLGRAAVPGFYGLEDLPEVLRILREQRGETPDPEQNFPI